MAEEANADAGAGNGKKAKAEVTVVKLTDGREVGFAGKRRMVKDYKTNEDGSVTATFDFVNGETRALTITPTSPLFPKFVGHGVVQKVGDETAGDETVEDMVLHVDAIIARLNEGEWGVERAAGDAFSGASTVIKAIMEASGKPLDYVKAFLEKKLENGKAEGLTRQKLYQAYRRPGTKTAAIIERLEREKLAGQTTSIDADADLAELQAA